MENDEPLDPMNVSFLCAPAIVTRANRLAHLIKQLRFRAEAPSQRGLLRSTRRRSQHKFDL
jgi:hypothetical protein